MLSVEIDARVERLAVDVAAGDAVAERADAGDAAIRIEIAELGRLDEADAAARRTRAPAVNWLRAAGQRIAPRELSGHAAVAAARCGRG